MKAKVSIKPLSLIIDINYESVGIPQLNYSVFLNMLFY